MSNKHCRLYLVI